MVDVHVEYFHNGQEWVHDFNVRKGATIATLRMVMVSPDGTKEDANAFELRKLGRRVPDYTKITEESTYEFAYLGREEGARRAAADEEEAVAVAAAEAAAAANPDSVAPATEQAAKEEPAASKQAPAAAPAPPAAPAVPREPPPFEVEVTVRHAMRELDSQVRVRVMSNATVKDVRRAVAAHLNEMKLSEVKLVKRQGQSFATLDDEERINDRREFLSMGRTLNKAPMGAPVAAVPASPAPPPAPAASAELNISVTIDRAAGVVLPVQIARGRTVIELKRKLADMDPTGQAKPDEWSVGLPARVPGQAVVPLSDSVVLTEEHSQLELVPFKPPAATSAAAAPATVQQETVPVDVTLTHAVDGSSVTVTVPSSALILEVRRAVMEKIGQTRLSEVKIVKKVGLSYQSLPDDDRLNGRTALKTMGCTLQRR